MSTMGKFHVNLTIYGPYVTFLTLACNILIDQQLQAIVFFTKNIEDPYLQIIPGASFNFKIKNLMG